MRKVDNGGKTGKPVDRPNADRALVPIPTILLKNVVIFGSLAHTHYTQFVRQKYGGLGRIRISAAQKKYQDVRNDGGKDRVF